MITSRSMEVQVHEHKEPPVTTSTATAVRPGVAAARATGLNKVYGEGETRVVALDNVSVEFPQG
ncbi:ABC transporter ATP-binding protein, partial [Kitasatospora sp. NPDC048545]